MSRQIFIAFIFASRLAYSQPDSSLCEFESNLTDSYGALTFTAATPTYTTTNCSGTNGLNETSTTVSSTTTVDLGNIFRIELDYRAWSAAYPTVIASNTVSGTSGWVLYKSNPGTRLELYTTNGSTSNSGYSTTGAITNDGTCYDIVVYVDKTNGYASFTVDGSYVTDTDSTIRNDFDANDVITFNGDKNGNNKPYSYMDRWKMVWGITAGGDNTGAIRNGTEVNALRGGNVVKFMRTQ